MAVAYTLDEIVSPDYKANQQRRLVLQWVQHVMSSTPAPSYSPPFELNVIEGLVPRDRQVASAHFLRQKRRACLWHVPGLGKTLCAALAAVPPVGVAAPTYLIDKWATWLERYVPQARGHIHVCTGDNMPYYERIKALEDAHNDPLGWTLFNKEMWRPETRAETVGGKKVLKAVHEDDNLYMPYMYHYPLPPLRTAILDEAHYYRVPKAWHALGAQKQLLNCAMVFELTATPFYKVHTDLFMQLAILQPKQFTSFWEFARRFAQLWDDGWGLQIANAKNTDGLNSLMAHFGLAYDYLPGEVPEVLPQDDIVVELPHKLEERLKYIKENYRDKEAGELYTNASQMVNAMMRISASCPQKLDALSSFHMDNAQRFDMSYRGGLVVVQHIETAKLVTEHLRKHTPFKWTMITGETPARLRTTLAENADNVVGTYESAGMGIDMSHLSIVHEYERWYVPGAETQVIARAVRQRHDSHPRPLPPQHRNEPVILQRYRLRKGPDNAIHNIATHRMTNNNAILDAIMRSV